MASTIMSGTRTCCHTVHVLHGASIQILTWAFQLDAWHLDALQQPLPQPHPLLAVGELCQPLHMAAVVLKLG